VLDLDFRDGKVGEVRTGPRPLSRVAVTMSPTVLLAATPERAHYDSTRTRSGDQGVRMGSGGSSRDLVGGFYENFNDGDIGAAVSAFSEELETTDPGMGTVHGIGPFREYLDTFKRAMPDARAIVERTYEVGDAVIVEGRFVGTHTGPLATPDGDVEPTGASVEVRFADVSRLRGGKITSYHTYYDQLGLMTQLGLIDD
jgi:ketosteroid isomerase-like protein